MIKQILIAVDQLINAILAGFADETLSARSYRMSDKKKRWMVSYRLINALFFWQKDHCEAAYISEVRRFQLPVEYR